jgi:putative spermidine/putrescine transport system substrate-binding protein
MSTSDRAARPISTSTTRRQFMQSLGALTGVAAVGGMAPRAARAQAGKMVLGTWGGDYSKLLTQNVETPILKPKGVEVVHDIAGDPQRRAKLVAEKRLPRGTTDLQALSAAGSYEMWSAGVLDEIDFGKIANAKHLLPPMKTKYSVGHIYSGQVILYNPALISPAPTSYNDLWDPKHQGKVGIIDIQYVGTIEAAALVSGGSMENFEPAKGKLMELRKRDIKMYPTNEAMAQALKTGEVGMCIMWKARGVMWQNAGVPVQAVAPKEGVVLYVSDFVLPKNAPNKTAAYAYLDAMLEPSAQVAFAETMGYSATVDNAKPPEAIGKRVGFTKEEQARLITPNYDYIAKVDAQFKEWWDKIFKA